MLWYYVAQDADDVFRELWETEQRTLVPGDSYRNPGNRPKHTEVR